MPQSIVCTPPREIDGYDNFLFQQIEPEPCSLTIEEFQQPDPCDLIRRRRPQPQQVITDEPRRWAEVLFEPGDVIEFRFLPSGSAEESLRPRRFFQSRTAFQHGFDRWTFACEIDLFVNKLTELNQGAATWWGLWNKLTRKWSEVGGEPGIPLNIYASANPRIATGCTTSDDVMLARSLFVDLEDCTVDEATAKLAETGLPKPTITVVSGHGVHFYWRLLEPITDLKRWTTLQKRLIQLFGSDPAIHDPARMMRLPGFMNVNGDKPTRCYIHEADAGRRYSMGEILLLFPPEPPRPQPTIPIKEVPKNDGINLSIAGRSSDSFPRAEAYANQFAPVDENRNSTAFSRTCSLVEKFDLTVDEALPLIQQANDKSADPLDDDELEQVVEKAIRHVQKKCKRRGTALLPPARVEKYIEPTGPVIELDVWRREMTQARLDSLNQPGRIFFDGSTTGAGKSTADLVAMKQAGKSVTFLPTHDACGEVVKKLTEEGLKAAAHPPLDESTCQKFGTKTKPGPARIAQNAGLNVGQCVCTECDLRKTCEYQRQRELARSADHTIATHARASLSDFQPAVEKPIVFVHEDALSLLRPMGKVVRFAKKQDVPQLRHLQELIVIAQAAEEIAITWQDEPAIRFAKRLRDAVNELLAHLISQTLIQPFEDAAQMSRNTKNLPSVMSLPLKGILLRPANMDYLMKRAMDKVGIYSNGATLKLAVGFALGELQGLFAVVDESRGQGGKLNFSKALLGVWNHQLPSDSVVWLENASTSSAFLTEIVGKEVIDKTPSGRLALQTPPLQFVDQDVTQQTSGKTVRSIIRGLLAQNRSAAKVGIITHQRHKPEIDKLATLWRKRIAKIEHFHSGKDRASNEWLNCDLILVLGTPRVPASAIRDVLIRLGRFEDAKLNGGFSSLIWEAKTTAGNLVQVTGLGYFNPSWAEIHCLLVRETLIQAVGRGRGVTDKAVPVLVVSNESLGLPVADRPLPLLDDSEDETLQLTVMLTDTNAKDNILGKVADPQPSLGDVTVIRPADITAINGTSNRTARRHLQSLHTLGLLMKKGERGGVIVEDWLRAAASGNKRVQIETLNGEGALP